MSKPQASAAESPRPIFLSWRFAFWGVILAAFALYIPSLGGAPVWDDVQILSGQGIGGGTVSGAITQPFLHGYFRPLVSLTLLAENTLFQGATFYYHLVNVLLHAATCAVLMGLLLASFRSRRVAILGGFLFAVHPLLVSTIAWIGGITDCLGTFLISLFAYALVLGVQDVAGKRNLWLALSTLAFFVALFCKEQTIALILLIPLAQVAFADKGSSSRVVNSVKLTLPYVAAAIVFLALWKVYFPGYPDVQRTLAERVQMIGQSLSYYTLALIFPSTKWLQTYTLGAFQQSAWTWTVLGFALLAAFLWSWSKVQRSDPKLAWFGALLLLSILPAANIIPPPSLQVAPYRAGLAVLGLAAVIAVLAGRPSRHRSTPILVGLYACWWVVLACVSMPQWSDERTLFSSMVQADPTFLNARRNLAYATIKAPGDPQENARAAVEEVETVLDQVYGSRVWEAPAAAASAAQTDPEVKRRVLLNKGPSEANVWLSGVFTQLAKARLQAGDLKGANSALEAAAAVQSGAG
jgi:hypothetical protein